MKISYKTLKNYIPNIKSPEEVAEDLIMHTAEVEEVHYESKQFENIVYGKITSLENHPDADALKICQVDAWETDNIQIVCGWSNLEVWQAVAVAKIGASVLWHGEWEPVVMKKTAIRWVESYGMICASDEIGLKEEYPANDPKEILDFWDLKSTPGINLSDLLGRNDVILEVDNKAINHRPDLFSHIWIAREICAISWETLDFEFANHDLSGLPDLWIKNAIPKEVKRYLWIKASWVSRVESPDYIKTVISSHWIDSKRLLVDVTNYSLYLYWQPTHIFDADKIVGNIEIRFAKPWEKFTALNDSEYELSWEDIVIADQSWVIALGWIIGWKDSAVSDTTENIIIEAAHFDQAIIRKTGKKVGLRTDALNVFEKDLQRAMDHCGASLIITELQKAFPVFKLEAMTDCYPEAQKSVEVEYDLDFINTLIWAEYSDEIAAKILKNLGIEFVESADIQTLQIPFWRKDLTTKADIAEEIARIHWYDKVQTAPPAINMWAVAQTNSYSIKNDTRNYFTAKGFFDMYNYSFVNEELMSRLEWNLEWLVPLKNSLSEEMTHMKWSLIPNLMHSLQENIREKKDLKLFEVEKTFHLWESNEISEHYEVASVMTSNAEIPYYEMQTLVWDYLTTLWVDNVFYAPSKNNDYPTYAHSWRTAEIIVRGKSIWFVWEIHPEISKRFDVKSRVAFFSINMELLEQAAYSTVKAHDISSFQMNNFDLSFVVNKSVKWKDIATTIAATDKKLIKKVELFDIFESEEKLPWKRSISFKISIQSDTWTLDDKVKSELIESIVKKVEKKGGSLR